MCALDDRAVHLHYCADDVHDAGLLATYRSLLTPEERVHLDRLRREPDRRRFLLTRALVRWALSQHSDVAPQSFVFGARAYGKPAIEKPSGMPLSFNASHTRGMVACVVAREREVGVDVENTTRPVEATDIAERFFSREERSALSALPAQRKRDRFFDYWTLKEAYAKGRGLGLSLPFDTFTIDFRAATSPRVADDGTGDGRHWQLRLMSPTPDHRLACAVRVEGRPVSVLLHAELPFAEQR